MIDADAHALAHAIENTYDGDDVAASWAAGVRRLGERLAIAQEALEQIDDERRTSLRWRSVTSGGAVEKPNVRTVAYDALAQLRSKSCGAAAPSSTVSSSGSSGESG